MPDIVKSQRKLVFRGKAVVNAENWYAQLVRPNSSIVLVVSRAHSYKSSPMNVNYEISRVELCEFGFFVEVFEVVKVAFVYNAVLEGYR